VEPSSSRGLAWLIRSGDRVRVIEDQEFKAGSLLSRGCTAPTRWVRP